MHSALAVARAQLAHYRVRDRLDPERKMREADWRILLDLYAHQDRTLSATSVAEHAPLTTMLRALDRLEATGLIVRAYYAAKDKRRVHIALTGEGSRFVEALVVPARLVA